MTMHPDPREELGAAIAAERTVGSRVKEKMPGTPDYYEAPWAVWQRPAASP